MIELETEIESTNGENDPRIGPAVRDLPLMGWPRAKTLLVRALLRRCPECGARRIFKNWLLMHDRCPRCGYEFAREGGYFLGAYALNLIAAEFIPVGLMIALLIWSNINWLALEAILIPLAVGLPFLFYPFARTFWMALDLTLQPINQR
jgi:uncharacterized protein (DUF983 family)